MELIEILQKWSGLVVALCAAIYGVFKYFNDYRNGREGVKQNQQHTEQERLNTDEKALDLDSRRVKASEEVASEALEDMAEARRENLKLLESDYEKSKAIIEMQAEIKLINAKIEKMEVERMVVYHYYCELAETCPQKKPPYGPFRLDAATLENLKKKIIKDGTEIHT
jgi:hypothetical protein